MSNREIIAAAYEGFNRRDIDAVLALMDEEVDWPNGMEGDRVLGRQSVREYWTRQWAMIDPHVDPVHIEDNEEGDSVVDVRQVVRDLAGNVLSDQQIKHTYHIENERIMSMDIRDLAPQFLRSI